MAVVKRSRQREAIKEFLMSRKDHPTAEVVYEHVSNCLLYTSDAADD